MKYFLRKRNHLCDYRDQYFNCVLIVTINRLNSFNLPVIRLFLLNFTPLILSQSYLYNIIDPSPGSMFCCLFLCFVLMYFNLCQY